MPTPTRRQLFDRELSWLAFNGRVLQEAQDPDVPLFERLAFLAIVSSNLDEFFRVRVASLRTLLRVRKKKLQKLGVKPHKLLRDIHAAVHAQQDEAFGRVLPGEILPALAEEGIELVDDTGVPEESRAWLRDYFERTVRPVLTPIDLASTDDAVFLEDRRPYLAVTVWDDDGSGFERPATHLFQLPTGVSRFVTLQSGGEGEPNHEDGRPHRVMFLDDVIRFNAASLFPDRAVGGVYAVKLSRDADLRIEDEFSGDLADRMRKALAKRHTGTPSRFLYDPRAPYATVAGLKERLGLEDEDLFAGGRYHNLSDYAAFPRFGRDDLAYPPLPPLPHAGLDHPDGVMAAVGERDHLLHLPYQSFEYLERFLLEAACDPDVEAVWASLYRVARDSAVVKALIEAARQGKDVTVAVEVQARFDEALNLAWADQLEAAGARVVYSRPGIKVHAKLLLVKRREGDEARWYSYLATGNFNEGTARFYTDIGLFTAAPDIGAEARQVFRDLEDGEPTDDYAHLLVAPLGMRRGFGELVAAEAERADAGEEARMILKMNSLEDPEMIGLILDAAERGVEVELIVRGICCLRTGGRLSGQIRVRSIVDRFLEHSRIYAFHNGGDPIVYLSSADWMVRNLTRRIEVAVPVRDPDLRDELLHVLALQLRDNVKARWIDRRQTNPRVQLPGPPVRSQAAHYAYLRDRLPSDAPSPPEAEATR